MALDNSITTSYEPQPSNGSAGVSSLGGFSVVLAEPVEAFTHRVPAVLMDVPPPRTRKVAILGFGATVKDAPVSDPSWDLWAMNGFWRAAKPDYNLDIAPERYSLWLDMHTVEFTRAYGKAAGFNDAQERWLEQTHPFPVLMLDQAPEFPSVQAFPIEDVVRKLGRDYFTSSVAYALAYALAQDDVAEIGLWGIDLVHSTEYADQRPCAEYWIGRAEAAGIKVTVHESSALLKSRGRYGYENANPLERELRGYCHTQAEGIGNAIKRRTAELEALIAQQHTDNGALQMVNTIQERLDIWNRGGQV